MTKSNSKFRWWIPPIEAYLLPLASFVAMVFSIHNQFDEVSLDTVLFGMIFLGLPLSVLTLIGFVWGKVSEKFAITTLTRHALFVWLLLLSVLLGRWVGRAYYF